MPSSKSPKVPRPGPPPLVDPPSSGFVDLDLSVPMRREPAASGDSEDTWLASSYDLMKGLKVNDFTDTFDDALFKELFKP